ncbi:transmembrane protein, putative (macronuclear) [Tetrahymena thermophila SB210]|uniref:Transmembrane protein, putative n=1 Tax=Tetrahymena thermophila (strain SB210) TaxID=312017 RepID=W7X3M6_TETTS|nr:transmembrane protein, putative [Tetrahymena thermophila SB210]EWS71023.1 transmembrane protein, putative [Tetrahymena thermophila SB210]|eukprot:XP_012656444.1 transmembrane protein, putative [Tetrahymena thermophila SB210]
MLQCEFSQYINNLNKQINWIFLYLCCNSNSKKSKNFFLCLSLLILKQAYDLKSKKLDQDKIDFQSYTILCIIKKQQKFYKIRLASKLFLWLFVCLSQGKEMNCMCKKQQINKENRNQETNQLTNQQTNKQYYAFVQIFFFWEITFNFSLIFFQYF